MFEIGKLKIKITPHKYFDKTRCGEHSYFPADIAISYINEQMIDANTNASKILRVPRDNVMYIDKIKNVGDSYNHSKQVTIKGDKKLLKVFKSKIILDRRLLKDFDIEV